MPKNIQTTTQLHSSHTSKVMLKILQAILNQYANWELIDVQAEFRKGRDQIAKIHWITEKARVPEKHLLLALLTMPKPLTVWITTNCGKSFKKWKYETTLPASWETFMLVKMQQLEWDMERQTGTKLGKEYVKAVYFYLAYLTYMQSTSWEMLG